jgi:hypothetical protein
MATTITIDDPNLARFNRLRDEATGDELPPVKSNDFLEALMDAWEYSDASVPVTESGVGEFAEGREVVREGCREAIREEFPARVFQS